MTIFQRLQGIIVVVKVCLGLTLLTSFLNGQRKCSGLCEAVDSFLVILGQRRYTMNIAVVGGGVRCLKLIELIETYSFQEISPKVIAVADIRSDAPGFVKAKEQGLFVTNDYNDFFYRDDIELIMELTGDKDVLNNILIKKKKTVRLIGHIAAVLFWEIARVSALQQETSQQLKETRAKYDVILNELINENVMVIDPEYRILDINETQLEKLGIKREEAIGRYCYEVTRAPCRSNNNPCPLSQALETKKPSQATHILPANRNKELYYSISCYPLLHNNECVGAINILRDITKDINMQKTMMQQEKLASIGRLSAGVAHEINNPLTTILTSAMLIQEDLNPDDPIYQELQTISDETLRCRKIVTSLLDFARQTAPAKRLNDLNDIITQSFVLTRKQAAFNDVTVKLNLYENLPATHVDKDQIEQALINLTLNAIEATDPGGEITITTRFDAKTNIIEISVSDTGVGIPFENMDKIFDPFFTTTEGGTGLGLAVTHGIVEQHGGTIEAANNPGPGTCFTIRLPLDPGN
jgi:PAS domain S-box-containing protein